MVLIYDPESNPESKSGHDLGCGLGRGVQLHNHFLAGQRACSGSRICSVACPVLCHLWADAGVAISGAIFQNKMKHALLTYPSLAPKALVYSKDAAALILTIQGLHAG
jgi:MinD superfamily P-loop ATPase